MNTNTNLETGIRYGTIYLNHLNADTADWLFTDGTNVSEEEAYEEAEIEIRAAVMAEIASGEFDDEDNDLEAEVARRMENLDDYFQIDEPYIEGECEGVKYGISWLGGAPLLWVYESPYITKHGLCSPCVPNAGDLESEGEYECYDVPPDWRERND